MDLETKMRLPRNNDESKQFILRMFTRTTRPVLIGQACLELHKPISTIEALFNELLDSKDIRELSQWEKVEYDVMHGFMLANRVSKVAVLADHRPIPKSPSSHVRLCTNCGFQVEDEIESKIG